VLKYRRKEIYFCSSVQNSKKKNLNFYNHIFEPFDLMHKHLDKKKRNSQEIWTLA